LTKTIAEIAAGFVETQRILDRAYLASISGDSPPLQRQYLSHGEIGFQVSVERKLERGFGLEARLLNLGFSRRFEYAEMSRGRVELVVRQVSAEDGVIRM
jgi:hypothetical protein